tara:strand:+ start:765 stop:1751 length:987 start_codon:yes stop_codon:yes gene_type:complete
MKINIIGAGTWGTALGCLLENKKTNSKVTIWQRDPLKTSQIINSQTHPRFKNFKIPASIKFTSSLNDLDFNELTIIAIPTSSIRDVLPKKLKNGKYIIASKGFDLNTGLLCSEMLQSDFNLDSNNIAILSGPNHAEEVIAGKASAAVIASSNSKLSSSLQELFSSDIFRVYRSDDILGVQIGAAVKNVIAIASGLCVGLNLGDNAQAALVSRGMNEIMNLTRIYSIDERTLYGLSGLGDLIATCYSKYSRNRELGILLAEGYSIDDAKNKIGMISEGINTSKILNNISKNNNLDMPICTEVYKILFEGNEPQKSLYRLMTRSLKEENN